MKILVSHKNEKKSSIQIKTTEKPYINNIFKYDYE